ncbi:RraA family protein [Nesterenkonia flava]|uniref:Putative 4-hydroxy-4-methyl-2-oxoglutarate aldolase n=1 Tax=Nesterenkonia flava TaxID=469799 RepID=A0ABU1FVG2_9MICC|nr:RraA family protein [Nesterenkonia flava]MDR5712252.1 RraA family protein [Nesterenkonia flava]
MAHNTDLLTSLSRVEFPTLGHFLEDGFCSLAIKAIVDAPRMVGTAATLRLPDADAVAVNRAVLALEPGQVLVIDMCGDHEHAPVGAVTIAAVQAQGAAGVVVDGAVTDRRELNSTAGGRTPLPVFARGTTALTTKRKNSQEAEFGVPVTIDGVTVRPGDVVLGDGNGVVILSPETAASVVKEAEASDDAEPAILRRIAAGEPLENILYLG